MVAGSVMVLGAFVSLPAWLGELAVAVFIGGLAVAAALIVRFRRSEGATLRRSLWDGWRGFWRLLWELLP
jgi:hypothetical protein